MASGTLFWHRKYVTALQHVGVRRANDGKIQNEAATLCHLRSKMDRSRRERTDVHIAVQLVSDALSDRFERAIIISADSDLAPAIRMVKQSAPMKEILLQRPRVGLRRRATCSHALIHTRVGCEALISRKTFRQRRDGCRRAARGETTRLLRARSPDSTFKEIRKTGATIDRPHHLQRPHTLRAALLHASRWTVPHPPRLPDLRTAQNRPQSVY